MYTANISLGQRISILSALSNQMRYLEDRVDYFSEKFFKTGCDDDALKLSHYREELECTRTAWDAIVNAVPAPDPEIDPPSSLVSEPVEED